MGMSNSKYGDEQSDTTDSPSSTKDVNPNISTLYLLSLSMLIIKSESVQSLYGDTLVLSNDQSSWNMTLIVHNNIIKYMNDNDMMIKIIFRDQRKYDRYVMQTKLFPFNKIQNTNFSSYHFYNECPIGKKDKYGIYIELDKFEHHIFDTIIQNDTLREKHIDSYYEIIGCGLNKYRPEEFAKYWSLLIQNYENVSNITYNSLLKNNTNLEYILTDPWFALFSLCGEEYKLWWEEKLVSLNSSMNWKKMYAISNSFYKKHNCEMRDIVNGIQKILGTIGCTISITNIYDINMLGNMCQKVCKYVEDKNIYEFY